MGYCHVPYLFTNIYLDLPLVIHTSYIVYIVRKTCQMVLQFLPKTKAASPTLRAIMPGTSIELTRGMRPCRDSRPYVGFRATMPQSAPGLRVEPPVSEPRALSQIAAHF